jgi:hypothetical protein
MDAGKALNVNFSRALLMMATAMCMAGATELPPEQNQFRELPQHIQTVLNSTKPLRFDRADRLPLYLWQAMDPGPLEDEAAQTLVSELDERGVALVTSWDPGNREKTLANSLTVAKAQNKLGLRVNINATRCLYSFFDGDPQTAHIDDQDRPFWDASFGKPNMGCPFTLETRTAHIRGQLEYFTKAFKKEGLDVGFIFADWEIDGPIEFNDAHAASQRCRRCREKIPEIADFTEFQKALRQLRSRLQQEVYAAPVKSHFPGVLVGNYGVYPHGGYRYWYDYYEHYVDGQPCETDQLAKYRKWYQEFPETGYTFAMPVVYTWERTFDWYDYAETDYRWFYNMLLVASNAGEHTPEEVPIISFVHWHTIRSGNSAAEIEQFSEAAYQELLWHMLLRGTDTFFLWCGRQEAAKEIQLVHEVYAEAQQYGEFLSRGKPVNFSIPRQPQAVISGLKLDNRILIRRTDFNGSSEPVGIAVANRRIKVQSAPGRCRIISLR